jgi:hypothetical protein
MRQFPFRIAVSTLLSLFLVNASILAQAPSDRTGETSARVPALEEFHKVIYQIWHTAWPNKDAALLKQLVPDVEKGAAGVAEAKLPGILREKQGAWNKAVKKLQATVAHYKKAAASGTDAQLLDAAEALHTDYEGLVRVIRPVMKEVEAFHAELYLLYHYYMPEYNADSIAATAARMQKAMESLNAASLPDRLQKKSKAFTRARAQLSRSVDALTKSLESKDRKTITRAIRQVHSKYQAVESVFK